MNVANKLPFTSLTIPIDASYWLPNFAVHILTLLVAFSMFALVVMNQAAQARLLYSMARDNMLPFSNSLKKVNSRTKTPLHSLVIGGIASLALMIYGYLQTNTFATLIGATSIAPYLVYLLIILSYMNKRKKLASVSGGFNLGKWGFPLMVVGLIWIILALLILILPAVFHGADRVVIGGLVLAAIWWIVVLRGRIARKEAGVPLFESTLNAVTASINES